MHALDNLSNEAWKPLREFQLYNLIACDLRVFRPRMHGTFNYFLPIKAGQLYHDIVDQFEV